MQVRGRPSRLLPSFLVLSRPLPSPPVPFRPFPSPLVPSHPLSSFLVSSIDVSTTQRTPVLFPSIPVPPVLSRPLPSPPVSSRPLSSPSGTTGTRTRTGARRSTGTGTGTGTGLAPPQLSRAAARGARHAAHQRFEGGTGTGELVSSCAGEPKPVLPSSSVSSCPFPSDDSMTRRIPVPLPSIPVLPRRLAS